MLVVIFRNLSHVMSFYLPEVLKVKLFSPRWKKPTKEIKGHSLREQKKCPPVDTNQGKFTKKKNYLFINVLPAQVDTQIFVDFIEKSYKTSNWKICIS